MMIYGWEDTTVRLPILGQIKLGEKGEKMPRALDYFLCPPEVQKVYGEKPKALDVIIPHPDIDVVLTGYLRNQVPTTGQLVCRGNNREGYLRLEEARTKAEAFGLKPSGENYISKSTGELCTVENWGGVFWLKIPCSTVGCPEFISGRCKPFYMLHFELPKVLGGAVGVYTIMTRSTVNYQNLKTFLQHVELRCGSIHRVPLRLRLTTRTAHPYINKGGKRERIKTKVQALVLDAGDMTSEQLDEFLRKRKFFVPAPQSDPRVQEPVHAKVTTPETKQPAPLSQPTDDASKKPTTSSLAPASEQKQEQQGPPQPEPQPEPASQPAPITQNDAAQGELEPQLMGQPLTFFTIAPATREVFNGRSYAMVAAIPHPSTAQSAELAEDVWFICTMAGIEEHIDLLLSQPEGAALNVVPAEIDHEAKKIAAVQVYIEPKEEVA